jgi:hypothetical protein
VIARLPFVERPDHPAGMPCLVVANAPIDREVMAATVLSVLWRDGHCLPEGSMCSPVEQPGLAQRNHQ